MSATYRHNPIASQYQWDIFYGTGHIQRQVGRGGSLYKRLRSGHATGPQKQQLVLGYGSWALP